MAAARKTPVTTPSAHELRSRADEFRAPRRPVHVRSTHLLIERAGMPGEPSSDLPDGWRSGCWRNAVGAWSARVHGSYLRFPADVPSSGRSVVLQAQVCRFTCWNAECGRRTFVEQIPGLTRRHSRRPEGLRSTLAAIGPALAGRAGARLAHVGGVSVSRSTVLRLTHALPEPEVAAPRVVGVDEYATRELGAATARQSHGRRRQ